MGHLNRVIIAVVFLFSAACWGGTYSGGDGLSAETPYQISSVDDWQELMNTPTDWDVNFVLTNDIDLAGITVMPVGNNSISFTGVFDGGGHIVRNAVINLPSSDSVGLFGYIGTGGHIRNLGAENVNATGRFYVGGLMGRNYVGTITNCYSSGNFSGNSVVGGLVGGNNGGTIIDCYSSGAVSGNDDVGGLAGGTGGGTITNCYSSGTVSGGWHVGGLVGQNNGGTIIDCYFLEDSGPNNGIGTPLTDTEMKTLSIFNDVGWDFSDTDGDPADWQMPTYKYPHLAWETVIKYGGGNGSPSTPFLISDPSHLTELSLNQGDWTYNFKVTQDIDMVGVAHNRIGNENSPFYGTFDGDGHVISNLNGTMFARLDIGTIKNLRLENAVTSSSGLLMEMLRNGGRVENCFVRGTVTNQGTDFGGLVGTVDNGTITDCGSDAIVTGGVNSQRFGGLVGELKLGTISNCYSTATVTGGAVALNVGGLVGKMVAGTIENCYSAASVKGAKYVGGIVGGVSTNSPFQSTITNCYSMSEVTLMEGTFGSEAAGGTAGYIEGLAVTVTNCRSSGIISGCPNSKYLGGIAGNPGSVPITDCFSDSTVQGGAGSTYLGGLVGRASGAIRRCSSAGSVSVATGGWYVGGLAGDQYGSIIDCYSSSEVSVGSTGRCVGGLIGYMGNGTIDKCFSQGPVSGGNEYIGGLIGQKTSNSVVTASFWDKDTSLQQTSAAGKGQTTALMQTLATFTSAGWDFVGETANGTDDFWNMAGYPVLSWQPAIKVSGQLSVDLVPNGIGRMEFEISNPSGQTLNWQLTGQDSFGWITSVMPASGSLIATASTVVTVQLSASGLGLGKYAAILTLSADNGDDVMVPLLINVFDRVDMADFAGMGNYWGVSECFGGDDCKPFDWYVDGRIDIKDMMMLAQSWLSDEIIIEYPSIEDGFESGDLHGIDWTHGGSANWTAVSDEYFEGSYSAKSGAITDSQTSELVLISDTTGWEIDTISFMCKVSSETGYDYLRFFIDGNQMGSWSGQKDWGLINSYTISGGTHTFRWVYSKDSSGFEGSDCAWIDDVRIYKKQ